MPFPTSFVKHTLNFSLPSGDVASTSCSWATATGDATLDMNAADELQTRALALWTAIKPLYAPGTRFTGSRIALVGTDGKTSQTQERAITPVPGSGAITPLPNQCAVVASLKTANAGRTARGRMYLPAPNTSQLTESARLGPTQVAAYVDAMQTYLSGATTNGLGTVVASAVLFGALRPVTDVRVGDVMDTQRRRRDELLEVYTTRAVT